MSSRWPCSNCSCRWCGGKREVGSQKHMGRRAYAVGTAPHVFLENFVSFDQLWIVAMDLQKDFHRRRIEVPPGLVAQMVAHLCGWPGAPVGPVRAQRIPHIHHRKDA